MRVQLQINISLKYFKVFLKNAQTHLSGALLFCSGEVPRSYNVKGLIACFPSFPGNGWKMHYTIFVLVPQSHILLRTFFIVYSLYCLLLVAQ